MTDATPKAEELAAEKGIDLDSVEGSGKDGRILVEDVEKVVEANEASTETDEAALEAEDPAEDAEVVGEVAGDPLVVSQPSPETSVEAFKAHPHVPVSDQTPEELKDFQEESLASVEGRGCGGRS
jgi:pyruvate/2-oxoglutarate dehydrogenase complex dihydrolipoamide acyltransferase (E2) component